jgi:CRP-like cAMP-binding protein
MHRISARAGETIYRLGEASDLAYLLLSGEVATVRGDTAVTSGKGTLIGFSGLFDRPYGSTATAASDCTLLAFSRRELKALLRSSPEEAEQIVNAMIDLLGRVAAELERKSADDRGTTA